MKAKNRPLDSSESSNLSESIRQLEKNAPKINWTAILVFSLLTILSAIHIYYYDKSNWSLISKCMVCFCPIIIWIIIENKYKGRTKTLNELKEIENRKIINVVEINARRVIEFSEGEDEGTLYLIEQEDGQCVYLWDYEYLISEDKSFPCDRFDVYTDNEFKYAIKEKVKCMGERIEPIKISGKDKWDYFDAKGFPNDLEIEKKAFDEVMNEISFART